MYPYVMVTASMFGLMKSGSQAYASAAVDVVPAARVEPDEVHAECGANLHQLKAGLDLLHQHVHLQGSVRQANLVLQRGQDGVPERRLFGRLDLRQVGDDRRAGVAQALVVVRDEDAEVDDGGREAATVVEPDVAVVEVQAARAEDLGREVELLRPVRDDRPAEEVLRPVVHLAGDFLGDGHEDRRAIDRELQVPLVVEGHGADLSEGVFGVEHPAVGAGEERVGDVSEADFHRGIRACRGSSALDPLALQVRGNLAPHEPARACVADRHASSRDDARRIEEADVFLAAHALGPPLDARVHHAFALLVEGHERFEHGKGRRRQDVVVARSQISTDLKREAGRVWHVRSLPHVLRRRLRDSRSRIPRRSGRVWLSRTAH
jgi:hypothetical protein